MAHLLSLTRAARLVGIPRGTLQKRIKSGDLETFEGQVRPEDLVRLYPDAKLEDIEALERFARIKDDAYTRRVRERILPDASVLAARLNALSREQAQTRSRIERLQALVDGIGSRLAAWLQDPSAVRPDSIRELLAQVHEAQHAGAPRPLAVQESVLRLIAAHARVEPSGREFFVEGSDSLLAAALRAGLALPYGCSDGSCGRCVARVVSGETQALRQSEFRLSAADEAAGRFLLCCHTAVTDVVLDAVEARRPADIVPQLLLGWVKSMRRVGPDILILRFQTAPGNRLRFLAGQSVTLSFSETLTGEYPIASCPCEDGTLEFHVRRGTDDFSNHLFDGLRYGDTVSIAGPRGDFVLNTDSTNSILFLAWDTGFAPIKGLVEQAMALDVAESLCLVWALPEDESPYQHNLCRAWSDAFDNLVYRPVAGGGEVSAARIQQWLADITPSSLSATDAYVSGPPSFVDAASQALRELGVASAQLYTDVVC